VRYRHFLLDLDDTLLDFGASERLSFASTLAALGIGHVADTLFPVYQRVNTALWAEFEQGTVSKDHLKVERFRRSFAIHAIDADPHAASIFYLDSLPECVVPIEGAAEICKALSAIGEVGIITNGIETVQTRRIEKSGLGEFLSFVATSETCGFAKPDTRFFEYSAARFSDFAKPDAIIIGDRLDADIVGAHRFGIDSCWFNPFGAENNLPVSPTYEVAALAEIVDRLTAA
jgi:2-haloacid dehalogenase